MDPFIITSRAVERRQTPEFLAEDASGALEAVSIACAVLTTIFLALRLFAKRFTAGGYGIDDAWLGIAYILNLGMCALGLIMVRVGGVGRHVAFVKATNPKLLEGWAKCILAFQMIYYAAVALPKMSIVLMYMRVFNWKGVMRGLAVGVLCLLAATAASFIVTAGFQCRPVAYWWDKTIPGGVCVNTQAFFHAQSVPGIILDFVVMGLPLHTIWSLSLPIHKRIALVFIFLVGSFGVIASIIRSVKFFSTSAFDDRTWASVQLVGWSIAEAGAYIIAACLPHLRPMISHYAPDWLKSAARKSSSYVGNSASRVTRSRQTRPTYRGDEEMELTRKLSNHGLESRDVERPGTGEDSFGAESTKTSATAEAVKSDGHNPAHAWGGPGKVVVTTEVKMERE